MYPLGMEAGNLAPKTSLHLAKLGKRDQINSGSSEARAIRRFWCRDQKNESEAGNVVKRNMIG